MLTLKGATIPITDPLHIANIFNDYFSSVEEEKTKVNIKFQNKSFQDFLHHSNKSCYYSTTDAHEGNLIISPRNSNKFTGLNSLLTKILNNY